MNRTCQYCSYESPVEARFCRQCGKQLFLETEASGTSTRNFGRQEAAPFVATVASGPLPPSVAEVVGGDTERYYRTPFVPSPVITPTSTFSSGRHSLRWVLLFFVLLLGVAMGALLVGRSTRGPRDQVSAEDRDRRQAEREGRRQQENERRDFLNRLKDLQTRDRDADRRAQEAVRQMEEASSRALEAGAVMAMSGEKLLDLDPYAYPGATTSNSIRIPGREMLTMLTSDQIETVQQFYKKKLGQPILQTNEPWEQRLVFQSNTAPFVVISIEKAPGESGPQLKITVLRSPFQKINLVPSQE
jgi:hypothetical protein